jgi:2-oxoglutarate ferredoxin oxidoreductase subunit beta
MPRTYKLEETGYDGIVHDPFETDIKMAHVIEKANEWGSRIPIGVFYQNEHMPTFQEGIAARIPSYLENPPAMQKISLENDNKIENTATNISILLKELTVNYKEQ